MGNFARPRDAAIDGDPCRGGVSRAIDRQKELDGPFAAVPIAIARRFPERTFERLSEHLPRRARSPRERRSLIQAADPLPREPIATRGRGDPCFCIALRGICISVNHCWIYVYDVETFSNLYLLFFFPFPYFVCVAARRPLRAPRIAHGRSWPRAPRDRRCVP